MLPLNSMFAMVDSKTLKDTMMENEGYLEKVIERLPYIGKNYKLEKEKERQIAEQGQDEPETEEINGNEVKPVLNPDNDESYVEKLKKSAKSVASSVKGVASSMKGATAGVTSYWNSFFVNKKKNASQGNTLQTDNQYIMNTNTGSLDTNAIEIHNGITSC